MSLAPGNNGELYIAKEGTLGQVDRVRVLEDGRYDVKALFGYTSIINDMQVLPDGSILLATKAGVWIMKERKDSHLESDAMHFFGSYNLDLDFATEYEALTVRALADGTIVATDANGIVHVFDGEPIT